MGKKDNYTGNEYTFRADLHIIRCQIKCYAMRSLRINKKKKQ